MRLCFIGQHGRNLNMGTWKTCHRLSLTKKMIINTHIDLHGLSRCSSYSLFDREKNGSKSITICSEIDACDHVKYKDPEVLPGT